MDAAPSEKEIERTIRRFRLLGWAVFLVGGLLFALALRDALDPAAGIRVNGVETRDFATKIRAITFVGVFPAVGLFLALVPQRMFARFMRNQLQRTLELRRSLGLK